MNEQTSVYKLIVPIGSKKSRKRVGRGPASGNGCTAGRGTKGQRARSGHKIRPGFEGGQMPLYRRLPRRGFSNYPFKQKPIIISLQLINQKYEASERVSLETLRIKRLIKARDTFVKILGVGDISKSAIVESDVAVANSVREKIQACGGVVYSHKDEILTHEKSDKSVSTGDNSA